MRTTAVSGAVGPKEEALFEHQPQPGEILTDREALAVSLAERIALDPHTVTDEFFESVKGPFAEEEIVEIVFACSIFNWGNKFNITMNLDSSPESRVPSLRPIWSIAKRRLPEAWAAGRTPPCGRSQAPPNSMR